jgi:DNA polymerase-3 subunit delta'
MWKNITGQDKVIAKLKSVFKNGRVAHAYLFKGLDGIGKDAVAIEFAKLLNCTNIQNGDEACDNCENCRKISSFKSDLFQFICALPAGRSEQTGADPLESLTSTDFDLYLEQFNIKANDPYHRIVLPNANNIRINSIRDLVSRIYLASGNNTRKVFLISEAEKMRQEAANALLKVLEEPPRKSVIILATSKVNSLPATIIGRCQNISFEPLSEQQVKNKLINYGGGYPVDEIELASRLCNGSFTRALELLSLGINNIRESVLSYLVATLKDDYAEMVLISRTIGSKNDKDKLRHFLFFMNAWFRDIMKIKYSNETNLSNYDLVERLRKFNKNYPDSQIYNIIIELEEADKLITQNVQLPLILVNLSLKLKKHLT